MWTSSTRAPTRLLLLVTLLASGSGVAQEFDGGREVRDTVEVRVVDIDVAVVDRRGDPVPGLSREDFEVFEDGRRVAIDYFAAPSGPSSVEGPAESPLASESREEVLAVGPRTVALYVDDYDLHPAHRTRVLADLRETLGAWSAPNVRFLAFRYRSQLELVAGPTHDVSEIFASLEGEDARDARGLEAELAIRQTQRAIIGSYQACDSAVYCVVCVDNWEQMVAFAADYARAEETRTAVAVAGLADLTSVLAGLPGRKDVLYVGDGFQQRPGMSMLEYVADVCASRRDTGRTEVARETVQFDESGRFTELAAHAAANRVTFHMLDAAGVRATSGSSVEFSDRNFAPTAENDSLRIANLQNSHFVLANETGGKAILNASRPGADVELLGRELAATYSLGFTPEHPPTGRVHLLEVKLVGPAAKGRRLRYRRSYRDKQLEARLADELVAALYYGEGPNRFGVRVEAGPTERLDRRRHELPVGILLPLGTFGELPGARSIRVWMTAVADDGRRTGVRQHRIELGPEGVEAEDGAFRFVVDMELPEGDYTIAVGVRDELTGESSFARLRASIPTPSDSSR